MISCDNFATAEVCRESTLVNRYKRRKTSAGRKRRSRGPLAHITELQTLGLVPRRPKKKRGKKRRAAAEEEEEEPAGRLEEIDQDRLCEHWTAGDDKEEAKETDWELLYLSVGKMGYRSRCRNTLSFSTSLLGWSKCVFLSKIADLANLMDPARFEMAYFDTDSMYALVSAADLYGCVKKGRQLEFKERYDSIFEDPKSPTSQAGLFKLEGVYG